MRIEGFTKGRFIEAPDDPSHRQGHELHHDQGTIKKHLLNVATVKKYGVRSVVETHGGFGMSSVEFAALGCRVTAIEQNAERAMCAARNLAAFPGCRVVRADNRRASVPFDAELVDIDPYDHPRDTLYYNRHHFRPGQLVFMTYGNKAWRFHHKRLTFLRDLDRMYAGSFFRQRANVNKVTGEGFTRHVVADYAAQLGIGLEYLTAIEKPGMTIERVLFRVTSVERLLQVPSPA